MMKVNRIDVPPKRLSWVKGERVYFVEKYWNRTSDCNLEMIMPYRLANFTK